MASAVWVLIIFILTIVGILVCINTTLKLTLCNRTLKTSYLYPPLIGCILLLITLQMTPIEMWDAIIGTESVVEPYTIILLVISIALVCISLDLTGALSYLSWRLISAFATTKLRLFIIIFLVSTGFSILTSNDVVVLTITPLVIYCAQFADISSTPYLYASFYGANLGSLLFVVGNPTNIIVAQAFGVTFAQYTWFMWLPALICSSIGFIVLLIVCRHELGLNMEDLIPIAPIQECLRMRALKKQHREIQQQQQLEAQKQQQQQDEDDTEQNINSDGQEITMNPQMGRMGPNGGFDTFAQHVQDHDQHTDLDDLNIVSTSSPTRSQKSSRYSSPMSHGNGNESQLASSPSYHWPGTKPIDPDDEIREQGDILELPYTLSSYEKASRTKIQLPPRNAANELKDTFGAIFHSVLLLLCLIMMAISSFIYDGIKIYMVSCAACVLSLIYDIIAYPIFPKKAKLGSTTIVEKDTRTSKKKKRFKAGDNSSSTRNEDIETDSQNVNPNNNNNGVACVSTLHIFNPADPTNQYNMSSHALSHNQSVLINAHDGSTSTQPIDPHMHPNHNFSHQPSAVNLSEINYRSTRSNLALIKQQQKQLLQLTPPKVVDPFAFDMEAIDSVDHVNTHIISQSGTYHNPFTSDEYEMVDLTNLDSASQTVIVTTEIILEKQENQTDAFNQRDLCVVNILKALPYDAPVFVCCMFILVHSLVKTGWVDELSQIMLNMGGGISNIALVTPDLDQTNIPIQFTWQLTFAFGLIELFLCNIMNNQPATILMTYVLLRCQFLVQTFQTNNNYIPTNPDTGDLLFEAGIHPEYKSVMIYATIAASNYSAIVSLVASLAGIIFSKIVKTKLDRSIADTELQLAALKRQERHPEDTTTSTSIASDSDFKTQRDVLIERQTRYKYQYISYLQFSSRGLYVLPVLFFGISFIIVAAAQYASA